MGMCMVDVTHLPEVRVGDTMVIFGEKAPVSDMAQLLQTIPYQLFAGIATRVKRVYIQE
jgi:Alr-MurF fusion protein